MALVTCTKASLVSHTRSLRSTLAPVAEASWERVQQYARQTAEWPPSASAARHFQVQEAGSSSSIGWRFGTMNRTR